MIRVGVFTAAISDHYPLRDPAYVTPEVDYWCASDTPLDSSVWRHIPVPPNPSPVMAARRFKLLLHDQAAGYDFYVWQDVRFSLCVDPLIFASGLMRHDVLAMRHPFCSSLRAEATEILGRNLAPKEQIDCQLAHYQAKKLDIDSGPHYSTGLIARRNDTRVMRFNRFWWAQLKGFGHPRDQMSFEFSAREKGISIGDLEGEYRDNGYAEWFAGR